MLSNMSVPVSELDPPATSPLPRVLGALIVVLLVAGTTSAVFVRDGERSAEDRFAAISAAIAEEPFAFEMTMATAAVPGGSEGVELTMTGAADPSAKRTRAEMDMSAVLPEGMGLPAKISIISDGLIAYVLVPRAPDAPPRWQRIDGGSLAQGATGGLPSSTNPLDSFEQLRAVDAGIEEVGSEAIRGVETTHFRTRIDMQKVLEAMPADRRPAPGTPTAQVFASMPPVPVDVWLDDRDRPRRQRMVFSLPADVATSRPALEMTLLIETFDFGTPVTIELPPADQVDDGAGVFGPPPS